MMNKSAAQNHKLLAGFVLLCFALFALLIGILPVRHIVVASDGADLACVWQQDRFILKWRHSVEKQLWQEQYEAQGDRLKLTATYLQAFGAGTPSQGKAIAAPTGFVGLTSDVSFGELNWIVSRNMQGEILSVDAADLPPFSVYQKVDDYTTIKIKISKKPRLAWFFMEKCHDADG